MNQLVLNYATQKMRRAVHKRLAELEGVNLDEVWLGLRVSDPKITDKEIQEELQISLDNRRQAHWSRRLFFDILPKISGKGPLK